MARDFSMDTVGGMLDDLKSRLGFNRKEGRYESEEYDDYGDYGYDYEEYGDFEDEVDEVGGYRPAQAGSSRQNRFGHADSSPNLVSFEDVKNSTTVPSRLQRDPLPPRGGNFASTTNVGGHTVIDTTVPAPASPAYKAAVRDGSVRSEGLNTLFEPPTGAPTTASAA